MAGQVLRLTFSKTPRLVFRQRYQFLLCGDQYELRRPRQTFPAMVSIFLRGIGDSWDRRLLRPRLALDCAGIDELLYQRSQVFGSLHSAKEDDPALDGFPFSSFVPLKKASRSTFDISRTARASHSRCHSSDHVLTGCPVISEIAVVSRE